MRVFVQVQLSAVVVDEIRRLLTAGETPLDDEVIPAQRVRATPMWSQKSDDLLARIGLPMWLVATTNILENVLSWATLSSQEAKLVREAIRLEDRTLNDRWLSLLEL